MDRTLTPDDLKDIGTLIDAKHAPMQADIAVIKTKAENQSEKWTTHEAEHTDMKTFMRDVNNKANWGLRLWWSIVAVGTVAGLVLAIISYAK